MRELENGVEGAGRAKGARTSGPSEVDWLGEARAQLAQGLAHTERGDREQALPCLEHALTLFSALGQEAGRGEALEALGRVQLQLGDLASAEQYLRSALTLLSEQFGSAAGSAAGDENQGASKARVLNLLAGVFHRSGNYAEALSFLTEVLELHRARGNVAEQASALCNIGTLHSSLGKYPEALDDLTRAYAMFRDDVQDERMQSFVLVNIGTLHIDLGEFGQALSYFQEALQLSRARRDRLTEVVAHLNIGVAQVGLERQAEAEQTFAAALTLCREIQYRQGEVSALDGLGGIRARRGELREAAAAHAEAAQIAREIEDLEGELDALGHLGQVQADLGELEDALSSLHRALALAGEADHQKTVSDTHRALWGVYKRAGDFERALFHHEHYHAGERALFNEEGDKKTRELSAKFDVERARHDTEVQRLQREVAETARAEAEAQVRERTRELERAQVEIVTRLAVAAEYRDDLTGEHTWRVGHVSALIARELGLPEEEVALLRIAARLHDVGKIGIPDAILLKPGKFSEEEFERMKAHTAIGARILSGGQSRLLRMAEEIALSHHERWDGGGYPHGRAERDIPLTGRIVSVADVFDALTSERPYKRAWTPQEAFAEMQGQAGRQFDPDVVAAGLRVFSRPDFPRLMRGEPETEGAPSRAARPEVHGHGEPEALSAAP